MASDFLQAFQVGANLMGDSQELALRRQQLRSQEAERQVRERLVAKQAEELKMERDQQIDLQADIAKALPTYEMAISPFWNNTATGAVIPRTPMAPSQAYMKFLAPTLLKRARTPEEAMTIASKGALMAQQEAMAERSGAWSNVEGAKLESRENIEQNKLLSREVVEHMKQLAANDPDSFNNQMKAGNLAARQAGLELGRGNLSERQAGTELRRVGLDQNAVQAEAGLAEKGFQPTIPLRPQAGSIGPQGVAAGQPLIKPAERPLTTTVVGRLQQDLASAQNGVAKVDEAIKAIEDHPESIGPAGFIGEGLETLAGIVNPNFKKAPITDARTKMRLAAHEIVSGLKTDSQISNYERKALDQIGNVTDILESSGGAATIYRQVKKSLLGKAMRNAKALNQEAPEWALRKVETLDDLIQLGAEDLITREDAARWARLRKGQ